MRSLCSCRCDTTWKIGGRHAVTRQLSSSVRGLDSNPDKGRLAAYCGRSAHRKPHAISSSAPQLDAEQAPPSISFQPRGRRRRWLLGLSPVTVALVAAVVLVDFLLLAGNVAYYSSNDPGEAPSRFGAPSWNGDLDGSFVEILGHAQVVAAVVVLLVAAVYRRGPVYATWALAFAGLFLDDFLQLHETWGARLAVAWELPTVFGLRAQDFGELLVWAGEALVLGLIVVIATILSSASGRRHSAVLLGCMVVIAVFGVGVDQVHIVLESRIPHLAAIAVTLTETAGELGGMSLALLAAAGMLTAPARTQLGAERCDGGPATRPQFGLPNVLSE